MIHLTSLEFYIQITVAAAMLAIAWILTRYFMARVAIFPRSTAIGSLQGYKDRIIRFAPPALSDFRRCHVGDRYAHYLRISR